MRRFVSLAIATALALTIAGPAAAGGPPSPAFYVDGMRYRTVGTPTDFFPTGAPAHSYDRIYDLGGNGILNVAEAAPGDRDYNGGRWLVFPVEWHTTPVQLTSAEAVEAYALAGMLTIAEDPVKSFACPVIPLGGRG